MTRRLLLLGAALLTTLTVAAATPAEATPPAQQHAATVLLDSPGCGDIFGVSQLCRSTIGTANDLVHGEFVKAGGDVLGGNGATAEHLYHSSACLTSALDCLADAVADAAGAAFRWLWRNIDTATSIDLVPLFHPFSEGGQSLMDVTIEIAALVGLALFFLQIVISALRAEPGGVGRAARGLVTAYVGSIVAILSIPLLDAAITQVCDGIVKTVTGKDLSGFGHTLAVAMSLNGITGAGLPIVLILVGFAIVVSAVIIWAAMMIRKMLVVVAAIFAPLAFSGATSDFTKNWARKWIEFTLAMLFSKLILVVIMTVGFMMMNGYSQHSGVTNTLTNVCIGVLLLALGGFAPLMALKMVHFAGEGFGHMHSQAVAVRANAQSIAATPQKAHTLASRIGADGARTETAGVRQPHSPLPTNGTGAGQARFPQQAGLATATAARPVTDARGVAPRFDGAVSNAQATPTDRPPKSN